MLFCPEVNNYYCCGWTTRKPRGARREVRGVRPAGERFLIRMVGQRSRHGGPQLISIKKSILSSTIHRQGAGPASPPRRYVQPYKALDLLGDRLTINLIVYQNANTCLFMRYVSMQLQHWIP